MAKHIITNSLAVTAAILALCSKGTAAELSSETLLALPPVEAKAPARAVDLDTATTEPVGPTIAKPEIYWGRVGQDGGLTVEEVVQRAWRANPNWATFSANHAAAHAELLKACALPNPELEAEVGRESSRETGESRGIWSLGFSQPIELPGKRAARRAEAMAGFAVVQGEMSEYGNTLLGDVRQAYWLVQYQAALEKMYGAQVSLTKNQLDLAQRRFELGDAGRIEVTNARVEWLKASRDREVARRRKLGARAALNALTGGGLGSDFDLAQDFPHSYGTPQLSAAISRALGMHPRLARLCAQLEQKYAGIERQRREWWPDVKVGGRKSKEFDGDSMAVTASVEIPLWNRNEGGIALARAEAEKVYAEIGIAYNELRADVEGAYQQLMIGREQIASYDEGLRDAAEEAVTLAWEQFNLGGGTYLDILIARRQLLEVQQGYIDALYNAALAKVKFDQAVGR